MAWTRTRLEVLESQAIRRFCSLRLSWTADGLHGLAERLPVRVFRWGTGSYNTIEGHLWGHLYTHSEFNIFTFNSLWCS